MKNQSKQMTMDFRMQPNDRVLLGGTRASYPWHWYFATVLWIGADDILVERGDINGGTWREVLPIAYVRAVGTFEHLNTVKRAAAEGVRDLQKKVDECERALGSARDTLWARLDEIAAAGLAVIPPDFAQIEASQEATRAAIEADETKASRP